MIEVTLYRDRNEPYATPAVQEVEGHTYRVQRCPMVGELVSVTLNNFLCHFKVTNIVTPLLAVEQDPPPILVYVR